MKNKLDVSRELDVWIWSNKPEIKEAANFLYAKIKKNSPNCLSEKKIKKHLKVILTDLFVAHKENAKLFISFSRDKGLYKAAKRFSKIFLSYKYIIFVTDFLFLQGYIELHKGVNYVHFRRMSRMKATEKLLRLFRKYRNPAGIVLRRNPPIILRDNKKRDIDFDSDTLEVKTLIKNTNKINKTLENHTIGLYLDWDVIGELISRGIFSDRTKKYIRIFNNSSFKQGGRFYCHWTQMIPSEMRRHITIDGEKTVEIDYSCLHLSMLYGLEGLRPPSGDLYQLEGIGLGYRKVIKKAVNIAINAESDISTMQAIREYSLEFERETGLIPPRPKILLNAIKECHFPINKYFCTGYGVYLQFIESSIAENIMLKLAEDNICCLCIHDSFIVSESYIDSLSDMMKNYFYNKFKFNPNISIKS